MRLSRFDRVWLLAASGLLFALMTAIAVDASRRGADLRLPLLWPAGVAALTIWAAVRLRDAPPAPEDEEPEEL